MILYADMGMTAKTLVELAMKNMAGEQLVSSPCNANMIKCEVDFDTGDFNFYINDKWADSGLVDETLRVWAKAQRQVA